MRNASIILGLLVGSIIAGATGHMNSAAIDTSPAITFLWVETFKLSLYPAAIIPGICVFTILAVEATGRCFGAFTCSSPLVLTAEPTQQGTSPRALKRPDSKHRARCSIPEFKEESPRMGWQD
jgi:hypothetical protein